MEIYKKVNACPKNELNGLIKVLEASSKVLLTFCGQVENRTYLLTTNRAVILVELLIWSLNRQPKIIFSLNFVPVIFYILIMLIKHRLPNQYSEFKEDLIEIIFCIGFLPKIK